MNEFQEAIANLTDADWQEIRHLDDALQAYKGNWGEHVEKEPDEDGVMEMPYVQHAPLVDEFSRVWYEKNLVVNFNWSEWDVGRDWFRNGEAAKYDELDAVTALKLLTAIIRNNRFREGALLTAFEDGDIPKIVHKFRLLHDA